MTAHHPIGRYIDRHAGDYECIRISDGSVAVEVHEGAHISRLEMNRHWASIVCSEDGSHLALRSHGREIEVGRHLCEEQRLGMARELRRELRG